MKPHNSTAISDKNTGTGRTFWLQSTLESYEVEELTGWQLASILAELPRALGAPDAATADASESP